MKKSQRRDFLKKSLLGLTAATLAPGAVKATIDGADMTGQVPELPSRVLGRTGISTPLISFGAAGATTPALIKAAYSGGVKVFFSATYYGEGNNERLVGEGLKGLPRDSFIVGTAVPAEGFDNRAGIFKTALNAENYISKAEASLKRFGLDYVDFFLFPYASNKGSLTHEPLLEALQKLRQQGKTRFLGIASHSGCAEALRDAADCGVYDVAMISYNFRSNDTSALNEAISYATSSGVGVLAMKTMSGVARSGKNSEQVNSDAAIKWVLNNKDIVSVVSGMTSVEQMNNNLAVIRDLKMTDEERKYLGISGIKRDSGLWCHQCRECIEQCRSKIEIPAAMRSYMYAYGYHNTELAQNTLREADISGNPCATCEGCEVNCTAGFDIREKMLDIIRLRDVPEEFLHA